jgi:hypothetical protein
MNDVQILTLAIAVVVPISLLLLSNSRLTDMRTTLQGSIAETRESLRNSIIEAKETLRAESNTHHVELLGILKAITDKLDEVDTRLADLERKQ